MTYRRAHPWPQPGRLRIAQGPTWRHPGGMAAPIVVHRPSETGGRFVTVRDRRVGLAHSDHDLVVFLEGAGMPNADWLLDDPDWVEWREGEAHRWNAA